MCTPDDANEGNGSNDQKPPEGFSFSFSLKIPPAVWKMLMASGAATPLTIWALLHR